jgi:hypothetical protein
MRFTALLILIFLGVFTGTALAQNVVVASDPSATEIAKAIFDAVMHSQWWAAAAYAVIIGVIGARKIMPASWKQGTKGDIIGTASAFAIAFAGAIGTAAIAPGATITVAVFLTALKIAVVAIGGYQLVHRIVGWLAAWDVLPAWVTPLLKLIAMTVGSKAIAKAEAAGAKAVETTPPTGMSGDDKIIEVE